MTKRYLVFVLVAVAALVIAGLAEAHVTVHPNALPSGGFTVVNIRVPNERATSNTAKVDVQFPPGFYSVDHQAVPGWHVKVIYRKLAKPITVNGQTQGQEVGRVVFTGKLPPKQFVDLPLSVAVPSRKAGTVLTFKALQTYSNGEIVRWIGPPDADTPAPTVAVLEPAAEEGAAAPAETPSPAAAGGDEDEGSDTLAIVALIVGIAALIAALAALLLRTRRREAVAG
jgi:periplasmic copper chaperone A